MKSSILTAAGILLAAIGGGFIGFTYGRIDMYQKTVAGVGLIEGGTPLDLDMGTLLEVSDLMSKYISPARAYAFAVAGLLIVLAGILMVFLADRANYRQASYVFLLTALAFMACGVLLLGEPVLTVLLGIKAGGLISITPYTYLPTRWLVWSALASGIIFYCLAVTGIFLLLRTKEREPRMP